MKRLLAYGLLAAIGLASCYSVKDAVKQTHRAKDSYPDTIAAVLRAWKPCIVTYKDTLTKTDTLVDIIAVECPGDTLWRTDTLETSYSITVPRIIKVPLPRVRETRTITINTKDMADVQVCQGTVIKLQGDLKSSKAWSKAGWITAAISWLIIALLIFMLTRRR